jgi:hypothetical protein
VALLLGFERKLEAFLSDLAVFAHWRILSERLPICIL